MAPVAEPRVAVLRGELAIENQAGRPAHRRRPDEGPDPRSKIVALTIADRERILRALDDPPTDALAELRGLLLREHEWRVREGLV